MSVSERIFEVLKNSGKKQVDLAKAVGVRSNTVSDWKNKDASPSAELIYPIAQFLGASPVHVAIQKAPPRTVDPERGSFIVSVTLGPCPS